MGRHAATASQVERSLGCVIKQCFVGGQSSELGCHVKEGPRGRPGHLATLEPAPELHRGTLISGAGGSLLGRRARKFAILRLTGRTLPRGDQCACFTSL